ncbi:putative nuclease HARBI1 [Helicoverpa armigera]|uniref:putative nuclease HARBI1 n=1 Tax=Helicoverpa zea TaxID=7113 RepID=UPI001F5AAD31|nr:putative nuclease HARBI1 [Helicoverpa zea]XP_047026478.1 putative nuclease HARBI1 [Helicoverpa zea]XP_047032858.1 putative nuclease HARBI1 [Helicoverpa zea]XP_049692740.1 putative nuclease HARBI1 [Helicoverpa armigera]
MQRPPLYERSTAYYFLAANLIENYGYQSRETREITRRAKLRNRINPLDINETEFKNRYRLNKEAFKFLCEQLKHKTSLTSSSRISLELKVLCALSFYANGSYQRIVGMAKYLGQTTVSKCVKEVTDALVTPAILNTFIRFPSTRAERDLVKSNFFAKYGFPGVIGCIDGCHFHIFTPRKEIEHLFYCRKHFHSLNVQMICDSDGRILNVNAKYGGATHDAFIWENSLANNYMQELHRNNEHVWLLGDSGYPQRPWLMTPIPDAAEGTPAYKYTAVHGKTRVAIENTFGRLKNRWRCLCKDRTLHYGPEKCAKIITACSVLHNLALKFNVPEPEPEELQNISLSFSDHLFQENGGDDLIRGRAMRNILVDRINRLHS